MTSKTAFALAFCGFFCEALGLYPLGRCPDVSHVPIDYSTSVKIHHAWYLLYYAQTQKQEVYQCTSYIPPNGGSKRLTETKIQLPNQHRGLAQIITNFPVVFHNETDFGQFSALVPEDYLEIYQEDVVHPWKIESRDDSVQDRQINVSIIYYNMNWLVLYSCEQITEKKFSATSIVLTAPILAQQVPIATVLADIEKLGMDTSVYQESGYNEPVCEYYLGIIINISIEESGKSCGHTSRSDLISYAFAILLGGIQIADCLSVIKTFVL